MLVCILVHMHENKQNSDPFKKTLNHGTIRALLKSDQTAHSPDEAELLLSVKLFINKDVNKDVQRYNYYCYRERQSFWHALIFYTF